MKKAITRRTFLEISTKAGTGFLFSCTFGTDFDVIIKNGLVLDGLGGAGIKTDIGIKGEKISAIGDLGKASAPVTVDASNLVVAPGFIDIHTHTDKELLINGNGVSKIMQGVTTEISGNCGSSPFPLSEADAAEMSAQLKKEYEIDEKWYDISGFFTALEKHKTSLNYASFTGHGDLRAYVVGKNDVVPDSRQMDEMKHLLEKSMQEGSLGLSSGLEYAPGSYAKTDELIELSRVVSKHNGIYNTHMRNEDDTLLEAIEEALTICRKAEVSVEIAHLKACNRNNWYKVDKMLEMLADANLQGLPVKADRYPYTAYGTGLSTFLPLWSRQGDTEDIVARLKDKKQIQSILAYAQSRGKRIGGWDRVMISSCDTDQNKKWEGQTIKNCAEEVSMPETEFIRTLLIDEKLHVGIVGFAMDEKNLCKVLSSPYVMIGSDGTAVAPQGKLGSGKPHPRYYGTFPRVLGKYCREEKCLDLPAAVKKMTSMPAEKLGLKERGIIKKGYFADITIFDPNTIIDKATFTNPHQTAEGIAYVFVNGQMTVERARHTQIRAGKVLRHSA